MVPARETCACFTKCGAGTRVLDVNRLHALPLNERYGLLMTVAGRYGLRVQPFNS